MENKTMYIVSLNKKKLIAGLSFLIILIIITFLLLNKTNYKISERENQHLENITEENDEIIKELYPKVKINNAQEYKLDQKIDINKETLVLLDEKAHVVNFLEPISQKILLEVEYPYLENLVKAQIVVRDIDDEGVFTKYVSIFPQFVESSTFFTYPPSFYLFSIADGKTIKSMGEFKISHFPSPIRSIDECNDLSNKNIDLNKCFAEYISKNSFWSDTPYVFDNSNKVEINEYFDTLKKYSNENIIKLIKDTNTYVNPDSVINELTTTPTCSDFGGCLENGTCHILTQPNKEVLYSFDGGDGGCHGTSQVLIGKKEKDQQYFAYISKYSEMADRSMTFDIFKYDLANKKLTSVKKLGFQTLSGLRYTENQKHCVDLRKAEAYVQDCADSYIDIEQTKISNMTFLSEIYQYFTQSVIQENFGEFYIAQSE